MILLLQWPTVLNYITCFQDSTLVVQTLLRGVDVSRQTSFKCVNVVNGSRDTGIMSGEDAA